MSLGVMFALGLAGSLHCLQMCGPLVLSFGGGRKALAHAAYHLGRIATYAVLGAVAGLLGSGMALAGAISGVQNAAAIVGGVLMIAAALLIGAPSRNRLVRIGPASRLSRIAGRLLRAASPAGKFVTGLFMGLLPCGMIYAALMRSVATGSPLPGALNMAAFGAGTAGPLLGLGIFSVAVNRRIGLHGQNWAAAGVMMTGAVLVWRGLSDSAMHHMH